MSVKFSLATARKDELMGPVQPLSIGKAVIQDRWVGDQ